MLSLSKVKMLNMLVGFGIDFQGCEDVQEFAGTIDSIRESDGGYFAVLRDQEDNVFDINIDDISLNDINLEGEDIKHLKEIIANSNVVFNKNEFLLMYENSLDDIVFIDNKDYNDSSLPKESDHRVWSLVEVSDLKFLINLHDATAEKLFISKERYSDDSIILVDLNNVNEYGIANMLEVEISKHEDKAIDVDTFDSKYMTILELDGEEELELLNLDETISFVEVEIGTPPSNKNIAMLFIWSNIDSNYDGSEDSEDGRNIITFNGYHRENFSYTMSQLPWGKINKENEDDFCKIKVDHRLN